MHEGCFFLLINSLKLFGIINYDQILAYPYPYYTNRNSS